MGERHIIIYSFSTCRRCGLVKRMLDVHDVQYEEIIDDKQLMEEKEIENVPALEVDGKVIDNYGDVLIWLRENGYYSLWKDDENESN